MTGPDRSVLDRNLAALALRNAPLAAELRTRDWEGAGYRVVTASDGRRVVGHDDAGRTPGGPGVERAVAEALTRPGAMVLGGVGDGRVLGLLKPRPAGPHGAVHAVYVCEPDLDRLAAALSLADLTGPGGALASDAVLWFAGPGWDAAYAGALAENFGLALPDLQARLGCGEAVDRAWRAAAEGRADAERAAAERARAWAASWESDGLPVLLDGRTPRRPRVLLITSRFTTVVRHSVIAAARGFAALGWETRVCTEKADHERLSPGVVVGEVGAFRPDLIVAVNYHRHHFTGLPDGVPFVCWIQDDMLHLIEPGAGGRLGARDFVMCAWAHRYFMEWGYPRERCVSVPRMVEATRGVRAGSPGADLVYVSSHSAVPRAVLNQMVAAAGGESPGARATALAGERLIGIYERGGSVATPRDLRRMLDSAARDAGVREPDPAWLTRVTEVLSLHLNNPLYRQQGLRWAGAVARARGLSLAVYGPGWEAHPEFAPFARGTVAHGAELDAVTRAAGFNLRLEPYPATCHQRLLEAIAAGGLVLNRRWSAWEEPEAHYAAFFLEHLAGRASSDGEAEAMLDGASLERWRAVTDGLCAVFPHMRSMDVTAHFAKRLSDGTMADYVLSGHPPRFFETVFDDEAGLGALVDRFLADPGERAAIIETQRAAVVARFSYETGLRLLLEAVTSRVATGAGCAACGGAA